MRSTLLLSAFLAPISVVLAAPTPDSITTTTLYEIAASSDPSSLQARQGGRPAKPKPCERVSNTTVEQTQERFNQFAQAFIYDQNITRAFEFIVQDYINHNPAAQNGFDSAWNILSPIWGSQNIEPLRTTFKSPQGWLNYRSGFGTIVDRFRWEGGCIAEHWDQGERYPEDGMA